MQWYEGGHTLYGPGTADFIRGVASHLTERLASSGDEAYTDLPQSWRFKLRSHQYFPSADGEALEIERQAVGEVNYRISGAHHDHHYRSADRGNRAPGRWVFEYSGERFSELSLNQPLLSIEYLSREKGCGSGQINYDVWCPLVLDGIPVDDQGGDLSLEHVGSWFGEFGLFGLFFREERYRASWYVDLDALEEGIEYRFRVEPRKEMGVFFSPVFLK